MSNYKGVTMSKSLVLFIGLFAGSYSMACSYDSECAIGATCVKNNSYDLHGVCVEKFGLGSRAKDRGSRPSGYGNRAGDPCSFDSQCGIGGRCLKGSTYSTSGTCSN